MLDALCAVLRDAGHTEFTIGRHDSLAGKFLQKPLQSNELRREVNLALASRR